MGAPVLLPAGFVRFGALRPFFAVADGPQFVGGNPELHQEVLGGTGAAVSEAQVILRRAAFIAMPFDDNGLAWEIAQDALQSFGILRKRVPGVAANVTLVVIVICILNLFEAILKSDRRRRWRRRRRGRWRRGDCHARSRGGGSAGSGRGQRVGCGVGGLNASVAGRLHGADTLVDGNVVGIAIHLPPQGGRLPALNRSGLRGELRDARRCRRRRRRRFYLRWRRRGRWRHFLLATRGKDR